MLNSSFKDQLNEQNQYSQDSYIPQNSSIDKNLIIKPSAITLKDNDLTQTGHSFNKKSQSKSNRQNHIVIENLKRENQSLKKQIFTLKLSQFYQLDEKKIKGLLEQIEQLKEKIRYYRQELEKVLIEKDFLQRNNHNLKQQCFNLTKVLMLERRDKTGRLFKLSELQLQRVSRVNEVKNIFNESRKIKQRFNSSRKCDRNSPYKQLLRIRSQQHLKALINSQSNDKYYKIQDK